MIKQLSEIENELEGSEYFENGLGWYMTFDVPDTVPLLTDADNSMEYCDEYIRSVYRIIEKLVRPV